MRVLLAYERSGRVRDAFTKRGHLAVSCDLMPTDSSGGLHYQGHVSDMLFRDRWRWDLVIAFPPCTFLCSSGLHHNTNNPERRAKTELALDEIRELLHAKAPRIAIENSIGCISTRIRKPDQIIQPYQFGHDASKATCLWLKNLPRLTLGQYVEPRIANGKKRWANQTDSGQNRLGPSDDRSKIRAMAYQGIADAMAEQWA